MTIGGRNAFSAAGVFVGPIAWLISTQANYALVPWICAHDAVLLVPVLAVGPALTTLLGGFLSWHAWRGTSSAAERSSSEAEGPYRFLAGLGVLMTILFALIILMQGAAGLVLGGRER
jgi:hypothetical protein